LASLNNIPRAIAASTCDDIVAGVFEHSLDEVENSRLVINAGREIENEAPGGNGFSIWAWQQSGTKSSLWRK